MTTTHAVVYFQSRFKELMEYGTARNAKKDTNMIKVHPSGRLGNNMFQYAMSRILSRQYCHNTDYSLTDHFPNAKNVDSFPPNYDLKRHTQIVLKGHVIGINDEKLWDSNIFLHGYFQRFAYYEPHKAFMKSLFYFENDSFEKPKNSDLVLHVRGGDLYNKECNEQHVPCPYAYYKQIIESEKYKKIVIVTENIDDIIVKKIQANYKCEVRSKSIMEDYYFMLHARKLAISVSTLAWWAAWLGNAKTIYFPMLGFWHPNSVRKDVDLIVTGDKRYNYYDFTVCDNWQATEEQIQKLLEG